MQGLRIINEEGKLVRPSSKKQVRETLAARGPEAIYVEATSVFGNEYDGRLDLNGGARVTFVGPDPHTSRRFYGTLTNTAKGWKLS